jgi:hypothetical protein
VRVGGPSGREYDVVLRLAVDFSWLAHGAQ